jgi:hypothetical protein
MNKLIRDGNVAVIFSPNFGAGFSTWGAPREAMFDPDLAQAVLDDNEEAIGRILETKYPDYTAQNTDLRVRWVPVGTKFRIEEYDGAESVVFFDESDYHTA